MIISLSGLDGSGKSTQVELMSTYLSSKEMDCKSRHLIKDSFSYFLTHNVVGKISSSAKGKVESGLRSEKKGFFTAVLSFVRKGLLFIDLFYFNIRYGFMKGNHKKTVICDRYFYDALVQADYLNMAGGIFRKIYSRFIIKPDISFFLRVDPKEAYMRKKEFDASYFGEKSMLYDKLIAGERFIELSSAVIEDTYKSIKEALQEEEIC